MRGTSSIVLRKLVRDFELSKYKYPINTGTTETVLLIWEHPDDSKAEALDKKRLKAVEKRMTESRLKSAIKLKRKAQGPYTRVMHQYGVDKEDGNIGGL